MNFKPKQPLLLSAIPTVAAFAGPAQYRSAGRKVGSGTGFTGAAGAGRLKHRNVSEGGLHSSRLAVARGPKPNPTVKGTSNSGLRPLSAAPYLRR